MENSVMHDTQILKVGNKKNESSSYDSQTRLSLPSLFYADDSLAKIQFQKNHALRIILRGRVDPGSNIRCYEVHRMLAHPFLNGWLFFAGDLLYFKFAYNPFQYDVYE